MSKVLLKPLFEKKSDLLTILLRDIFSLLFSSLCFGITLKSKLLIDAKKIVFD